MASALIRLLLIVAILVAMCVTTCVRGFATCHLLEPTEDGQLAFVEDGLTVQVEYEKQFKEITCSAHNYCTITWKKDDQPINETEHIQLWDKQQRLRFKQLEMTDSGNYTCEVSNGKHTVKRTVSFNVISTDCDAKFKPINLQHHGCSNVNANLGDNVIFNCQFFIGLHRGNTGNWFKLNETADPNDLFNRWIGLDRPIGGTVYNVSDYHTGKVAENGKDCDCSDCQSVLGSKLIASNVTSKAYGTYVLYIYNYGLDNFVQLEIAPALVIPEPVVGSEYWHHFLTIPLVCVAGVCFVVFLGWFRFKTDIKLKWKDFASKKDHSKTNDVYLSYDWTNEADRGFAISLAQRLGDLGYKVFFEINCLPGGDTDEDILEGLETSCRCIIIFSPEYLASRRNLDVVFAMDNAKHYKKEIIPIIYRDISAVTGDDRNTLVKQILSMQCLRYDQIRSQPLSKVQKIVYSVLCNPYSEKSLHKELLLRLPPRGKSNQQPTSDLCSDLISSEIPRYFSSQESMGKYRPASNLSPGIDLSNGRQDSICKSPSAVTASIISGSKLYPDISGFSTSEALKVYR